MKKIREEIEKMIEEREMEVRDSVEDSPIFKRAMKMAVEKIEEAARAEGTIESCQAMNFIEEIFNNQTIEKIEIFYELYVLDKLKNKLRGYRDDEIQITKESNKWILKIDARVHEQNYYKHYYNGCDEYSGYYIDTLVINFSEGIKFSGRCKSPEGPYFIGAPSFPDALKELLEEYWIDDEYYSAFPWMR